MENIGRINYWQEYEVSGTVILLTGALNCRTTLENDLAVSAKTRPKTSPKCEEPRTSSLIPWYTTNINVYMCLPKRRYTSVESGMFILSKTWKLSICISAVEQFNKSCIVTQWHRTQG